MKQSAKLEAPLSANPKSYPSDDWFVAEVEVGLQQIEQGQTMSHEEVGERLRAYLAAKQRTD